MADEQKSETGILEENPGETSTMRVVSLFGSIVIIGTWLVLNIVKAVQSLHCGSELQMIDFAPQTVIVLGSLLAGKVVQKFAEK